MRRFKRLGISEEYFKNCDRNSFPYSVSEFGQYPSGCDEAVCRELHIFDAVCLALLSHYEWLNTYGDPFEFLQKGGDIAVDYFHGEWRNNYLLFTIRINREQSRKRLPWMEAFRRGVYCSLVSRNRDALEMLTQWIDTDLPYDDVANERLREDNYYYQVMAFMIQGTATRKINTLAKKIKSQSHRRPKLLLETLEAIFADDSEPFAKAFINYLKYFARSEFNPKQLDEAISIDGTILWHLAKNRGVELPDLPLELMDLIVTRESLMGESPQ